MKTILGSMGLLLFFGLAATSNARACSPLTESEDASSEAEPDDVPAQSEVDESKGQERPERLDEQNGPGLYRFFGATMLAASAGDLATTEWGLTKPGIYETNPLATNRNARVTAHVLVPTVVWWTTNKMRKSGHYNAALWIRIGVTAAYGYAIMHNLRTAGSANPINSIN